jgi:hypothetical protein
MESPEYYKLRDELGTRIDAEIEKRLASERALQAQYMQFALKVTGGAVALVVFIIGFVGYNTLSDISKKTEEGVKQKIEEQFAKDNPVVKYESELRELAMSAHLQAVLKPKTRRQRLDSNPEESLSAIAAYLRDGKIQKAKKVNALVALRHSDNLSDTIESAALELLVQELEAKRKFDDKDDSLIQAASSVLSFNRGGKYLGNIADVLATRVGDPAIRKIALTGVFRASAGNRREYRDQPRDTEKIVGILQKQGGFREKAMIELMRFGWGEKRNIDPEIISRITKEIAESGLFTDDKFGLQELMDVVALFPEGLASPEVMGVEFDMYTKIADSLAAAGFRVGLMNFAFSGEEEYYIGLKRAGGSTGFDLVKYRRLVARIATAGLGKLQSEKGVVSSSFIRTLSFWLPEAPHREFELFSDGDDVPKAAVRPYWVRLRVGPETRVSFDGGEAQPIGEGIQFVVLVFGRAGPQPSLGLVWRKGRELAERKELKIITGLKSDDVTIGAVFDRITMLSDRF